MKFPSWRRWFGLSSSNPVRNPKGRPARPSRGPLRLEHLEDRLAPAITILDSGAGPLDGLLGPSQGTITAAQSTGAQTLSRAALQGVGAGVNISITSDGITFDPLSSTLTLQTGLG